MKQATMIQTAMNLGFLTVLQEGSGYVGGYLATNTWGRPLEFRLSTVVQPTRVQQILFGNTLHPYIFSDLIGKALIDKAATTVHLLITDRQPVLELRHRLGVPVAWLAPEHVADTVAKQGAVRSGRGKSPIFCHPGFAGDAAAVRGILDRLEDKLDLTEPFERIREAVVEARKLGMTTKN